VLRHNTQCLAGRIEDLDVGFGRVRDPKRVFDDPVQDRISTALQNIGVAVTCGESNSLAQRAQHCTGLGDQHV
jgi:hypothetical protein